MSKIQIKIKVLIVARIKYIFWSLFLKKNIININVLTNIEFIVVAR